MPSAPITDRVHKMIVLYSPETQKKRSWWTANAKKTPPIAPMIAAPIFIIRFKIKPRKTPMQMENMNEKMVLSVDKSYPYCANSILSIKKRSIVIPKPAIPPVAKIVISKKSRP